MSDVDEVKQRLNIVDIIGERVPLKKAGRNFKGLCPFHREKTPSFMVSPERQTFHCFGCGKGGSVIDFVMEYEHVDFFEALEELAERAGVTLTKRRGESPEQKLKEKLYSVNNLASEFYQYILTRHQLGERARQYLLHRGVSDKSIKTFGLGYSPNSWEALFGYLRKKGYDDRLLQQAGLVIRGSRGFYDRFRGRIMFTLRDHRGNVIGFSGRVLDTTVQEVSQHVGQGAKYINTAETPVYSKSNVLYGLDVTKGAIGKAGEAICMEGEFDVISSFQEGIANVVAIKGSALTEGHVRLLKRFAKSLVFCLDSDTAGDAAIRRGVDIAEKEGLEMKAIVIPSGKDPDEAVRGDPIGFKKAVSSPVPIYDFFLSSIQKRFDMASAYGKKKAGEELLPIFSRMTNAIVRGHYIKKLANLMDVSEEYIEEEMRKQRSPIDTEETKERGDSMGMLSRQEKTELYTLALLLQGKTRDMWGEFEGELQIQDLSFLPVKRILQHIKEHLSHDQQFSIATFVPILPTELISVLDMAYLWDVSSFLDNEEKYHVEWMKTIRGLHRMVIKKKIRDINESAKEAEESDVQEEISRLSKKLAQIEKSTSF